MIFFLFKIIKSFATLNLTLQIAKYKGEGELIHHCYEKFKDFEKEVKQYWVV